MEEQIKANYKDYVLQINNETHCGEDWQPLSRVSSVCPAETKLCGLVPCRKGERGQEVLPSLQQEAFGFMGNVVHIGA